VLRALAAGSAMGNDNDTRQGTPDLSWSLSLPHARPNEAPSSRSLDVGSGARRPYRGGVRTEILGSPADIKVFVPGTQGVPGLGAPSLQSARGDVGCAANATPKANTAAAVTITLRRYMPHPPRLDLTRRSDRRGIHHRSTAGGATGGESITAARGGATGGESITVARGGATGGESITVARGGATGGESTRAKAELATAQPATKRLDLPS